MNIGLASKGRKHSDETKRKISESVKRSRKCLNVEIYTTNSILLTLGQISAMTIW